MRFVSLALLLACVVLAVPAKAGTVTFTDGRGTWKSTQCPLPTPPSAQARNPEMAANDLNWQWTQHNEYVAAVQSYMNCVSQEAQRDADAASQMVTRNAQSSIQQMQNDVAAAAAQLPKQAVMQ